MINLRSSLLNLIKTEHRGKARAITVDQLATKTLFESVGERRIRAMIRDLNFEGHPILTTVHPPYGVFFAESQDEVSEYLSNLSARMKAILERMKAVDRMRAKEFLRGQLELFA